MTDSMGEGRWLREPPEEPGNYVVVDRDGLLVGFWTLESYFNPLDNWPEWVAAEFAQDDLPLWVWSVSLKFPPVPEPCGPCSLDVHDDCFRKSGDGDCGCVCSAGWRVFSG